MRIGMIFLCMFIMIFNLMTLKKYRYTLDMQTECLTLFTGGGGGHKNQQEFLS